MKRTLFGCAVLVLALSAAFAVTAEETPPVVSTLELEQLLAAPVEGSSEQVMPEPFLAAAFSCPSYTIACTTNASCDNYCGTPGWGVCQWMGSARRRCCFCLG